MPPSCSAAWISGGSFPFSVNATVINDCNINAGNIDLGTSGVLGGTLTANGTVSAQCTAGDSYSISLSSGTTPGASLTDRQMRSAVGAVVHYQLYSVSNFSSVWGDGSSGTSTVSAVGNGERSNLHRLWASGSQSTPAPGSYSDVITATIAY